MLSRRIAATSLRSPVLRQLGRRQLHGAGESGLQGAADNAFNRERAAVKEHAAGTSGKFAEDSGWQMKNQRS